MVEAQKGIVLWGRVELCELCCFSGEVTSLDGAGGGVYRFLFVHAITLCRLCNYSTTLLMSFHYTSTYQSTPVKPF